MRILCSKKGFSLAEIIASIGIFLVVGVFVVQVFSVAANLSAKAEETDRAAALMTSVAEIWKSGDSPHVLRYQNKELLLSDETEIQIGKNLQIEDVFSAPADTKYVLFIKIQRDLGIYSCTMQIISQTSEQAKAYSLECGRYFREEIR